MTFDETVARLKAKFGEDIGEPVIDLPERKGVLKYVFVTAAKVAEICQYLHDDPELCFEHLSVLTGTDHKDSIQVSYVMMSYKHRQLFMLKARLDREKPVVPSVASIWATADWHERETWDLVGVVFEGHPHLTRLMMPDDWVGHPLRKDYQEQPSYHGIPTTRENPLGRY